MESIFTNTLNSKTNESNKFIYQFTDKLNHKNPNKNMALANLGIYHTWKNNKSEYSNNEFKILAATWHDEFNLPDRSYSVSDIQDYFEYIINKHETIVGTHWIALYVKNNEVIYFDSFGVEHVPKEIKRFTGHKNIKTNIFRIQADNSIMCRYFCVRIIDFMLAGRSLIDFTNLFCPYDFQKNDDIILSNFK